MWRLDYISSENSKGFHAGQESVRILGESIDFSRQAQTGALRWRAPDAPSTEAIPKEPVYGVTPEGEAPPADDIDVDIEGGEAELEPEPDGGAD